MELDREHVKGHSDDKKEWDEMTRQEQVNVMCDEQATSALEEQIRLTPRKPKFYPLPQIQMITRNNVIDRLVSIWQCSKTIKIPKEIHTPTNSTVVGHKLGTTLTRRNNTTVSTM